MAPDDEAARKARAKRLHQQIDEAVAPAKEEDKRPAQQPPESPREFIHRKMRGEQGKKGKGPEGE